MKKTMGAMIAGIKVITSKYMPKDTVVLMKEPKPITAEDISGFMAKARDELEREQNQSIFGSINNALGSAGGVLGGGVGALGPGTLYTARATMGALAGQQRQFQAGIGNIQQQMSQQSQNMQAQQAGAFGGGALGSAMQGVGMSQAQQQNVFGMDMAAGFNPPDVALGIDWHDDGSIDWWSTEAEEEEVCV